ncbi:MAG: PKD domain-containing protein, partial [Bacteroidota bacterium]
MKNLCLSFSRLVKLMAITCLLISARQSMACQASFTYVIDTATRSVTFTSTSTGTNPYVQWRFIDEWVYGNTYTRQFNPGYHYVCLYLTSSTDTSCHSTVCDSIFIPGSVPCHASISYPINNGTKPGIYFFAGYPSTGANLVYDWTFSGGTEAWPLSSPALKNRYLDAGIYTVCLTVTNILDSTCHDDTCVTVVVDTPYCYANYTFIADTSLVSPVYYFHPFNTDSGNTYLWTFTNVATGIVDSSTAKSPTKIITNNTAYVMVCLTITNSIKGCTET